MNAGTIWWGQIGNALRLLGRVTESLRDCRSAVLQGVQPLPWRQDFYEAVDLRRAAFSGQRRLKRLAWEPGCEPGEFILDELCSGRVRADYWPGKTYAEYLGSRPDIVLNDYYVWVTGICKKADLALWVDFVSQYERTADALGHPRAVFLLEYRGPKVDINGIENIPYRIQSWDCRVFCLESAAALENTDLPSYQAELALSIAGDNPELCFALLQQGSRLLHSPVQTAIATVTGGCTSDGCLFPAISEQQATSAAWKAGLVLLYPILEQHRMDFVSKYIHELSHHLPITSSNGTRITDPWDLEIGQVLYIITSGGRYFDPTEVEAVRLCRNIRNQLAHNEPVAYWDAKALLEL